MRANMKRPGEISRKKWLTRTYEKTSHTIQTINLLFDL